MILTIDIGNSNTVLVGYTKNKEIIFEHRVLTFKNNTTELFSELLKSLKLEVEDIIVSCVVPNIQKEIENVLYEYFGKKALIVNGDSIRKLKINIDTPSSLGADLICTSVGACSKYDTPVIVADIGSASKVTLTNTGAVYEGGIIWPGLGSSLKSMVDMIPHLPKVDLVLPKSVIGKNTIHAIQSGMLYGVAAQVEGLAQMIEKEIGVPCERVLTGGYSVLFKQHLPNFKYEEHLVSDGLIEIYLKDMIQKD